MPDWDFTPNKPQITDDGDTSTTEEIDEWSKSDYELTAAEIEIYWESFVS